MTNVRIVVIDYYMHQPVSGLDICNSEFRGSSISKVPVLRVFGSTNRGEKVCLHVHRVFPYIYIPFEAKDDSNTLAYQIAFALDKAINVSIGQASSNQQHVYNINLVSAIPFYGYHAREHQFFKISFYNPLMVKKACNLLQNSSIMGRIFQPYESHIPFHQQFMIDYNLHGMNFIRLSNVSYRNESTDASSENLPSFNLKKLSTCKVEMDTLAENILNRLEVAKGELNVNPGIQYICNDEKQRRRNQNEDSLLSPCLTNNRSRIKPTLTHLKYKLILEDKLKEDMKQTEVDVNSSVYPAETPTSTESILSASSILDCTNLNISELDVTICLDKTLEEDAEFLLNMYKDNIVPENVETDSILSQCFNENEESDNELDLTMPLGIAKTPVKTHHAIEEIDDFSNDSFFDSTLNISQLDGVDDEDFLFATCNILTRSKYHKMCEQNRENRMSRRNIIRTKNDSIYDSHFHKIEISANLEPTIKKRKPDCSNKQVKIQNNAKNPSKSSVQAGSFVPRKSLRLLMKQIDTKNSNENQSSIFKNIVALNNAKFSELNEKNKEVILAPLKIPLRKSSRIMKQVAQNVKSHTLRLKPLKTRKTRASIDNAKVSRTKSRLDTFTENIKSNILKLNSLKIRKTRNSNKNSEVSNITSKLDAVESELEEKLNILSLNLLKTRNYEKNSDICSNSSILDEALCELKHEYENMTQISASEMQENVLLSANKVAMCKNCYSEPVGLNNGDGMNIKFAYVENKNNEVIECEPQGDIISTNQTLKTVNQKIMNTANKQHLMNDVSSDTCSYTSDSQIIDMKQTYSPALVHSLEELIDKQLHFFKNSQNDTPLSPTVTASGESSNHPFLQVSEINKLQSQLLENDELLQRSHQISDNMSNFTKKTHGNQNESESNSQKNLINQVSEDEVTNSAYIEFKVKSHAESNNSDNSRNCCAYSNRENKNYLIKHTPNKEFIGKNRISKDFINDEQNSRTEEQLQLRNVDIFSKIPLQPNKYSNSQHRKLTDSNLISHPINHTFKNKMIDSKSDISCLNQKRQPVNLDPNEKLINQFKSPLHFEDIKIQETQHQNSTNYSNKLPLLHVGYLSKGIIHESESKCEPIINDVTAISSSHDGKSTLSITITHRNKSDKEKSDLIENKITSSQGCQNKLLSMPNLNVELEMQTEKKIKIAGESKNANICVGNIKVEPVHKKIFDLNLLVKRFLKKYESMPIDKKGLFYKRSLANFNFVNNCLSFNLNDADNASKTFTPAKNASCKQYVILKNDGLKMRIGSTKSNNNIKQKSRGLQNIENVFLHAMFITKRVRNCSRKAKTKPSEKTKLKLQNELLKIQKLQKLNELISRGGKVKFRIVNKVLPSHKVVKKKFVKILSNIKLEDHQKICVKDVFQKLHYLPLAETDHKEFNQNSNKYHHVSEFKEPTNMNVTNDDSLLLFKELESLSECSFSNCLSQEYSFDFESACNMDNQDSEYQTNVDQYMSTNSSRTRDYIDELTIEPGCNNHTSSINDEVLLHQQTKCNIAYHERNKINQTPNEEGLIKNSSNNRSICTMSSNIISSPTTNPCKTFNYKNVYISDGPGKSKKDVQELQETSNKENKREDFPQNFSLIKDTRTPILEPANENNVPIQGNIWDCESLRNLSKEDKYSIEHLPITAKILHEDIISQQKHLIKKYHEILDIVIEQKNVSGRKILNHLAKKQIPQIDGLDSSDEEMENAKIHNRLHPVDFPTLNIVVNSPQTSAGNSLKKSAKNPILSSCDNMCLNKTPNASVRNCDVNSDLKDIKVKRKLNFPDLKSLNETQIVEDVLCHHTPKKSTRLSIKDKHVSTISDEISTSKCEKDTKKLTTVEKYDYESNYFAMAGPSKINSNIRGTQENIIMETEDLNSSLDITPYQLKDRASIVESSSADMINLTAFGDQCNQSSIKDRFSLQEHTSLQTVYLNKTSYLSSNEANLTTTDGFYVLVPKYKPPTFNLIASSMSTYNIPLVRNQAAFYGDCKDKTTSIEVGNKVLKIFAKSDYPQFESKFIGISKHQMEMMKNSEIKTKDFTNFKLTHCSNDECLIEPITKPPSRPETELWLKAKSVLKKQKEVSVKRIKITIPNSPDCDGEDETILTLSPTMTVSGKSSDQPCSQDSEINKLLLQPHLFENDGSLQRSHQISGNMNNTHGFKMSLGNYQNARSFVENQFLTTLAIELHIQTRGDLKPDPQHDPICAIFYSILHDTPEGKENTSGMFVVNSQLISPTKLKKTDVLQGSGVNSEIKYVDNELELFSGLLEFVKFWDPDILMGYEIEMLSWGYFIERGFILGLKVASDLSRIRESEQNKFKEELNSEIKVTGRIVLDVWRLLRSEIALQSYTFENVVYHVLHQRIPLYELKDLTNWWVHKNPKMRQRTAIHYMYRVETTLKLVENFDLIGRTSELARLFGILFFEVLSRGSQFRVESMMLRLAKPLNYIAVSPDVEQRAKMRAPEFLPLILEPESQLYVDPVIVLDFQSLYPSIIIAYNYCFSTCIGRVEHLGSNIPFEFGATHLKISRDRVKRLLKREQLSFSPCGVGFVSKDVRLGILPRMLQEIIDTRLMVKKSMKAEKANKTLLKVLHSRQLGLKLIANVTYGYTSANFSGRMPLVEVGDSVVAKGRETLQRAINLVEQTAEWGAKVVYGDTDSLFVIVPGRSREDAFKIGAEIAEAVTNSNPSPVRLKLEKVYQPCILQTKKRYVGYMYESPEQEEAEYEAKGIETVRRDGCPAVSKMLEKCLRLLFETKDISLIRKYVVQQFDKLLSGRVSIQDLTFAKEYRGMSGYKPGACVPALELTRKWMATDKRNEPRSGERVPYIIVNGPPGLPLIKLVRSPREFLENSSLRTNAIYYITKVIIPPINRCLKLVGADLNNWFNEMPRKHAHQYLPVSSPSKGPKTTISQYFSTKSCAACETQTKESICTDCQRNSQSTSIILHEKIRVWEQKYYNVLKICESCGSQNDMKCISLDCPVLYRVVQTERDLQQADYVRGLITRLSE